MAQLLTLTDEHLRDLIIAADTDAATRGAAVNVILQRKRSAVQLAEQTILAAQQLLEKEYGWCVDSEFQTKGLHQNLHIMNSDNCVLVSPTQAIPHDGQDSDQAGACAEALANPGWRSQSAGDAQHGWKGAQRGGAAGSVGRGWGVNVPWQLLKRDPSSRRLLERVVTYYGAVARASLL